jgi:predicted phosphoribosyltransferase
VRLWGKQHAGDQLADSYRTSEFDDPLVVALPRAAVGVALEVARQFGSPLLVIPVEEISSPGNPEFIVGAVASSVVHLIEPDALDALGVTEDAIAIRVAEATARLARTTQTFRGAETTQLEAGGRSVLVVDDGSATAPALEALAIEITNLGDHRLTLLTPTPPSAPLARYEGVVPLDLSAAQLV